MFIVYITLVNCTLLELTLLNDWASLSRCSQPRVLARDVLCTRVTAVCSRPMKLV